MNNKTLNYYQVLNVSIDAEPEVIQAAYKALVKKYHPDNFKGTPEDAIEIMTMINEAYNVLSDENKRKEYLRYLEKSNNFNMEKKYSNESSSENDADDIGSYFDLNEFDNIKVRNIYIVFMFILCCILSISIVVCMVYYGSDILETMKNNFFGIFKSCHGLF